MSQLRVTKKATLSGLQTFAPLLLLGCVVLMFATGATEHRFGDSETDEFVRILPVVLLAMAGLLMFVNNAKCKGTYISVYDDHVEGVGIAPNGFNSQSFRFEKSSHYVLHPQKNRLSVACGGVSLNVFLNDQDARAVVEADRNTVSYAPRTPRYEAPKTPKAPKQEPPKVSPIPQAPKNPTYTKPQSSEAVELFCVYCGFKCRVPVGKGKINITCPNCQKKFQHET